MVSAAMQEALSELRAEVAAEGWVVNRAEAANTFCGSHMFSHGDLTGPSCLRGPNSRIL